MAVAVVTGAGAGVGRATAREFARQGYDVGLIGRDMDRLEAAAREVRTFGCQAFTVSADVADAEAVDAAADAVERALGPIEAWVNNAMATVYAPVLKTSAEDVKRGTEVSYLGTVYGTVAALKRMSLRDRGIIINVGSALAYRSIPLQAVYCGAKAAVRGFTDTLRTELVHDRSRVRVSMVHLPAINTPQFDWAMNHTGWKPKPVAPVYQPEVAARAIVFAARHPRREVWVGYPTILAILGNRIAPGLLDRYLGWTGYKAQLTGKRERSDATGNLYEAVPGPVAAHGRFDVGARDTQWEVMTDRHRDTLMLAGLATAGLALRFLLRRKNRAGS